MLRKISVVAALAALVGCATTAAPPVDTACSWTREIRIHQASVLTDDDARQILSYDLARKANCPAGAE